uniref:UDP-glucuronosyltransferase n=1 Tax=Oryzias latipes TaxID=8090 RepID=A0A3P9ID01_ORYLA
MKTGDMHPPHAVFGFFTLCLSLVPSCSGGNILVYPADGSHWINMKILVEELHARGHNITVIRPSNSWYIKEKSPFYTTNTIQIKEDFKNVFDLYLEERIRVKRQGASLLSFFRLNNQFLTMFTQAHEFWCNVAKEILGNQDLVKQLIESKYDLVLTDPFIGSGVILAKYLNLPVVFNVRWINRGEGHFFMAPSPLSYIPVPESGLTDKMDFIQRLKNVFFYSIIKSQENKMLLIYDELCSKYIEGGCSIISLLQQADIWLFRSDFVFDFPRPTMPNVVYISGFQCKPAEPLPADLENFVQSSGEHGVIIMSLGALVNELPNDITDEIATVFSKMPQKVIWRHKGDRPSTLGDNTLIVDWMPQKDLLGHPQVKVFVAHGGTNGVQEAIYHGVPVLGIPLFFDQYDNLLRLQERGAGKIIEIVDLNGRTFEEGLKEVLHNSSYRQNIQRLSRLHKDKPMSPMDQAIFWIEYVIRHKGARHLISEAYKMPWYSYHSLDVVLLLLAVGAVLLYSIYAVFRFLCCRRKRKTKTKQN